jgi:pimeloyl-ACP methyl ester carboxylesterase
LGEDHRSWRYQQRALSESYCTIAYDIRGHGLTPIGDALGSLDQLGEDLADLIDGLELAPVPIVGYSLGGTIGMWVAANRPELVSAIAVVASSSVVGRRAADAYRASVELVRSGDLKAIRNDFAEHTLEGLHRRDVDVNQIVDYALDAIGDGLGYCNASLAMANLYDEPLAPHLQAITCRTLVVGGQFDTFCPRKAQDLILDSIPQAEYREIPDVGHLINDEDPESLTSVVASLLERP